MGSIPGLGRSLGEGSGNALQYSCLGNPMDRGAWRATVHRVAKSQTQLSNSRKVYCIEVNGINKKTKLFWIAKDSIVGILNYIITLIFRCFGSLFDKKFKMQFLRWLIFTLVSNIHY